MNIRGEGHALTTCQPLSTELMSYYEWGEANKKERKQYMNI